MKVIAQRNLKNHVQFQCPFCNRIWERDLDHVEGTAPDKSLRCRCSCKENFFLLPDRRRHFRKEVQLSGAYIHDRIQTRGLIHFKDISLSGARFEMNAQRSMQVGDPLLLRFSLDDPDRSFVQKDSVIRSIEGKTVCVEFLNTSDDSETLSRYFAETESAE